MFFIFNQKQKTNSLRNQNQKNIPFSPLQILLLLKYKKKL